MIARCSWPRCDRQGTHAVTVSVPSEPERSFELCREHDRRMKTDVVRSRPRRPAEPSAPDPAPTVLCGGCGRVLAESASLPADQRQPCPECLALGRRFELDLRDNLDFHESLATKQKRGGTAGWFRRAVAGDSYTRDLAGWGTRQLVTDTEAGTYLEIITLWDGTRICSSARLTDHRDSRDEDK